MKPTAMHPAAAQELNEITDYYTAIDLDLADAFVDCFKSYEARITEFPQHFSIRRGVVRRVNLTLQFGEYYPAVHDLEGFRCHSRRRARQAPPVLLAKAHWRSEEKVLNLPRISFVMHSS